MHGSDSNRLHIFSVEKHNKCQLFTKASSLYYQLFYMIDSSRFRFFLLTSSQRGNSVELFHDVAKCWEAKYLRARENPS